MNKKDFEYKKEIKLIAIDMDGTACEKHGETIKANIKPILEAQNKGVKIIFATGRPLFNVRSEALKYKMQYYGGYAIAYNGASIWNLHEDKEWRNDHIDGKIVNKICKVANKYGIGVWCYSEHENKVVTNFASADFEESEFLQDHIKVDERKSGDDFTIDCYKIMIINYKPNDEGHQLIQKICKESNLNTAIGISPVYEINSSKVNKGVALTKLAEKLKIPLENVMAIGDGHNDIPMFKVAGLPIAMGNALDEVKSHTKYVTDTNTNGGVAKAIEKFVLKK